MSLSVKQRPPRKTSGRPMAKIININLAERLKLFRVEVRRYNQHEMATELGLTIDVYKAMERWCQFHPDDQQLVELLLRKEKQI
jgi:hypothetical protein